MIMRDNTTVENLLFLAIGLALIFFAHAGIETTSPMTSRALEAIGFAIAGYAPIQLIMSIRTHLSEGLKAWLNWVLRPRVKIVSHGKDLPLLIVADVEGCITPPRRTEVDLQKFRRLRTYCEFVKSGDGRQYPPLVIYTGRSQGYVELLAQSLGMIDDSRDLPFVIENGTALYYPASKKTVPLITVEQQELIQDTYRLLSQKMSQNEFEPKTYMITINAIPDQQTIDDLLPEVTRILTAADTFGSLTINSTASAVDITPKGINKLFGIEKVLKIYLDPNVHPDQPDRRDQGIKAVVGIGDSTSDLCVIEKVGTAYCPAKDVHPKICGFVEDNFGADHIIDRRHIDFVIAVIEKECGLSLI